MKKIFLLALAASLSLFVACGDDSSSPSGGGSGTEQLSEESVKAFFPTGYKTEDVVAWYASDVKTINDGDQKKIMVDAVYLFKDGTFIATESKLKVKSNGDKKLSNEIAAKGTWAGTVEDYANGTFTVSFDMEGTNMTMPLEVKNGSIRALANGEAQVHASYTDVQGIIWKKSFVVKVTGLDLGALTALSSLSDITDQPFAIVNKESQKMFYGPENQNLDMGDPLGVINNKSISGYMFKAEAISGRDGCYLLRLMTLNGSEYSVYGKPGYLNSQPTTGWCSFILGLNNQNGEDVKDGAVWEIKYESGKGFTLKNMATGKYLKDAAPAKYDAPAYFDFLKSSVTAGIHKVERSVDNDAVYTLQGIKIATLQQWDALPRGIYIVGGKKKLK